MWVLVDSFKLLVLIDFAAPLILHDVELPLKDFDSDSDSLPYTLNYYPHPNLAELPSSFH